MDAAASVGARGIAMLASSITALLVAATLAQSEYGAYALAVGIAGVLGAALDLGLTSSLARYVAQRRATGRLVAQVVGLRSLLLLVGALGLVAFAGGSGSEARLVELLPFAALVLVLQGATAFLYGTLPAMRRIRLLLVVTVLQPLVELAGVLVARARGGDAPEMLLAAAAGGAAASLVGYGWLLLGQRLRAGTAKEPASLGDVARYGRHLFAVLLLVMVFGQLDQFVIAAFHGTAAVAPYALAIKLQALLVAPAVAATAIVAPRIAGAEAAAAAMYRQWLGFLAVLHLGAVLVFAVLARDLFAAINPLYEDDAGVLLALLPFMLLTSLATLPSVTLNQVGYAASRVRIAGVTLAVNLALDLLLVPPLGAYGAAISTTVAFALYLAAHHRLVERALRAQTVVPPPPLRPVLVRGAIAAGFAGLLAALLRPLAAALADGRAEPIVIVVIAGGVPALVHAVLSTRVVRRGALHPPESAGRTDV